MAEPTREIKGYQLQGMLGEGGFGTVYRAYQPLIRREVAIKVIRSSFANQPEFIRRFEAEAQLVARLEHIHIVPLYDFWRDPGGAYLVMRLLRGGSLREELQEQGRLQLPDVLRVISQISSALSVAHRKGVIHRDLKPANILLDEEKNAYLTDFGIAKDVEHGESEEDEDEMVVGTPAYSPPEQLQSQIPTPRSDIYSFGLIVYELITGKDAMSGNSISEAIRNQLYEPLPDIDPDEYGIPMSINDILGTATAKDPEDRYADILHFARDFRHAFDGFNLNISRRFDEDTGQMVIVPEDTMAFTIDFSDVQQITGVQQPVVNPYKGLRAFQESDATDFYGRADLTEKLINRLNEDRADARFLAVIGPSGSGKSSVVKAGVIPAVRQGILSGSEDFFVAEMVPGADALDELETVLLSIAVSPPDNLRERLESSETGLFELLNEILPDDDSELFLLIDQFEEIFTQTEDNRVRTHFMNSLQHAVTHPESRLWTIITIRADFYDKPLLYPGFGELVRERGEVVLPLSRNELESAIVQPSKSMGIEMEQELVARIIQDVQEEPGALPLLQYALTELFDRRSGLMMTLQTYLDSGGVLGSLARRAEELYLEMDERHQEAVRQLFLRLVTLGEGTEDTRRRVRWSELSFYDADDDPLNDVLDTFTKYRLLTGDNDPQTREPTVEVAHEALIRQWQRLRDWLSDNRENIRIQRQVVAAVNEWHQNHKDDSFLASGMRLNQFEILLDNSDIALTQDESNYIKTSIEQREAELRAEQERQAREHALEERAQRNLRYLVAAMTVGLIIASGLAIFAFIQQQAAEQAEAIALDAQAEAETAQQRAEREALENNSISLSNLARFWGRAGENPLLGLAYAIEANNIDNPPVEVQRSLADLAWQPGAIRQLVGHGGEIWGVEYSADGQYVYTAGGSFSGQPDNTLIQWNVNTGDIENRLDAHTDRIYSVDVSPDGRYIATGSQDTNVIIWNAATGTPIHILENHSSVIFEVKFSNDSTRLISGGGDTIMVWDVASGTLLNSFDIHGDIILDMDVSADNSLVFSGSFDGSIALWELETGNVIHRMEAGQITGARFLPGENRAVTSDQNGNLIIWNLETGEAERTIQHLEAPLRGGVVVAPDGNTVIAADDNGNLIVWDISSPIDQPELLFRGHDNRVTSLAINPDGDEVTTVSFDYTVIVWDLLGRDAEIQRFTDHSASVYAAVESPDRTQIASGSADGRLIIWNTDSGDILHDIQIDGGTIYGLDYHPDGNSLLSSSEDGIVRLWDVNTGELMSEFTGLEVPVRTVTFSPDGTLIAAAGGQVQISDSRSPDNRILVWNSDGDIVHTFEGHQAAVRALLFTPDGTALLSGSDDTQIILWTLATGEQRNFEGHTDAVWTLAFNADGSQFLSGSRDRRIIRWNTETGEQVDVLTEHRSGVRAVAFHPDGVHAVSAAGDIATTGGENDYELLYWDLNLAVVLREFPGHSRTIRSLSFSEDGTEILSSADDASVILWHADTLDTLIERLGQTYQIICAPDAENTVCSEPQTVFSTEGDEAISTITGFPTQVPQADLPRYTENSLCLLPDNGTSPPAETVDTAIFVSDAPYTIGYSNGGQTGTSADWIAAWAQYEADQQSDLITDFIMMDANGNAVQQIADITMLLNGDMPLDALIVNPVEQAEGNLAELQTLLDSIIQSGIPVILVGNRIPEAYTGYVGHDPYEVGCIMGQELTAFVDGEGSIGFINAVDLSVADLSFKEGARAVLNQFPGIERTAEGATGYQRSSAESLTANVDIVAMLGYVGDITLGAQDGVASRGLNYVPFVSDHNINLARFAQINGVDGVFIRSSSQMGANAVQTAIAILQAESVTQFERVVPELIRTSDLSAYDIDNAPDNAYIGDWENLPESYYP